MMLLQHVDADDVVMVPTPCVDVVVSAPCADNVDTVKFTTPCVDDVDVVVVPTPCVDNVNNVEVTCQNPKFSQKFKILR